MLEGNENLTVLALSISRVARVGRPSSNAQISALNSDRYVSLYIAQLVFVLFYILKNFQISRDISLNVNHNASPFYYPSPSPLVPLLQLITFTNFVRSRRRGRINQKPQRAFKGTTYLIIASFISGEQNQTQGDLRRSNGIDDTSKCLFSRCVYMNLLDTHRLSCIK